MILTVDLLSAIISTGWSVTVRAEYKTLIQERCAEGIFEKNQLGKNVYITFIRWISTLNHSFYQFMVLYRLIIPRKCLRLE